MSYSIQRDRRDQINQLADVIRSTCDLSTPLDTELAVQRLGGTLAVEDGGDYEAKIEKCREGFKITLGGEPQSDRRRRFSIAHELGHLFLHMGYLVDEGRWNSVGTYTDSVYYRFGFTTEEYEAHEFAAALLMPRLEFARIAAKYSSERGYQVRPIAEHFQVSEEAALNRGRWLGIFSWE